MLDILAALRRATASAPRPAAPPRPDATPAAESFAPALAARLARRADVRTPKPAPRELPARDLASRDVGSREVGSREVGSRDVAPRDATPAARDAARPAPRDDAVAAAQRRFRDDPAPARAAARPDGARPDAGRAEPSRAESSMPTPDAPVAERAPIARLDDDAPRTGDAPVEGALAGRDVRALPQPLDGDAVDAAPLAPADTWQPIARLGDLEAQSPRQALDDDDAARVTDGDGPSGPGDAIAGSAWLAVAPAPAAWQPIAPAPAADTSQPATPADDDATAATDVATPGPGTSDGATVRGAAASGAPQTTAQAMAAAAAPAPAPAGDAASPAAAPPAAPTDRTAPLAQAQEAAARAEARTLDAAMAGLGATRAVRGAAAADAVTRDLARLDPEFKAKLERVIARMEREFGHEVTVSETWRSQARQDALYAQGRTADGPVVTWTRTSKHSRGLAADLVLDGSYDNPAGYARLAQVAKEEGLRTLAPNDPGHVELPGAGRGASLEALAADARAATDARAVQATRTADAATPDGIARVADVAQVARVAKVADVARVASPGEAPRAAGHEVPPVAPAVAPVGPASPAGATLAPSAPRTGAGVEAMERVAKLMDLQAAQGARPLNGVLLRMERGAGMEDVIRVGMRGQAVDASLGIGDPVAAAALSGRVAELRAALERRGLATEGLTVQATRPADRVELSSPAVPSAPGAELAAAVRTLGDAALQQQAGRQGQDAEAQRRALQQENPFAQPRDDRRTDRRAPDDDARRQPRREAQEDRR